MCDTFAALGEATKNGSVIFGKNSDRRVNEPSLMVHVPRKKHAAYSELKTTYITIPQARQTNEIMLFKPSWIWGAEIGCNEFGLCIGNEAVFTKEPLASCSLIGMDYVRLALERCENAFGAMMLITDSLGRYNQGGNCAFEGNASYHNSFLLADSSEAYVLETAGVFWAAKKIRSFYAISNCLSIGEQFDYAHTGLVDHAIEKGWCDSAASFHFANCYGDRKLTAATGGIERRKLLTSKLESYAGAVTADIAKELLRLHDPGCESNPFVQSGRCSVCMHGGDENKNQTTGSFVAELGAVNRYWATGASLPCVSAFKPVCFGDDCAAFEEDEPGKALDFWKNRELVRRAASLGIVDFRELRSEALALEARFALPGDLAENESKAAFRRESERVAQRLETLDLTGPRLRDESSPAFEAFWRDATDRLILKAGGGMDQSIPRIKLMMTRENSDYPRCPLPDEFKFCMYRNGLEGDWARIESSVGEFADEESALEYFAREFLPYKDELYRRMVFVCDAFGRPVGTITSWFGDMFGFRRSRLHWFAVSPEFQGFGLSKPLLTKCLEIFNDLTGDTGCYLTVQTWSYRAARLYLQYGFLPYTRERPVNWFYTREEYEKNNQLGWGIVNSRIFPGN